MEASSPVSAMTTGTRPATYETDFYTWTQQQAELLRQGKFQQLDVEHLIEEIQDLGNRHYDQLVSRLRILIAHCLKWQVQHWQLSNSWKYTIREQRRAIARLLKRNPGLKSRVPEAMQDAWSDGLDLALQETNLPEEMFPTACPYEFEQLLNPDFWPSAD